jgi:hypothetical protein
MAGARDIVIRNSANAMKFALDSVIAGMSDEPRQYGELAAVLRQISRDAESLAKACDDAAETQPSAKDW